MNMNIGRTEKMDTHMDLVDPTDPNKVSISTVNKFVSSYVRKISVKDAKVLVVAGSIMCTRSGEAVFDIEHDNRGWSKNDLLGANMRLLAKVLMSYNANLSLLRFEVDDERKAPSMFLDPETIKAMYSGRFMSDPMFMYSIKNGISLVNDRSILLSRGNVLRSRRAVGSKRRKM
jgi:hypothetical protein